VHPSLLGAAAHRLPPISTSLRPYLYLCLCCSWPSVVFANRSASPAVAAPRNLGPSARFEVRDWPEVAPVVRAPAVWRKGGRRTPPRAPALEGFGPRGDFQSGHPIVTIPCFCSDFSAPCDYTSRRASRI